MTPNLEWLFSRQRFGIRPGLGRVRELLERAGHPERAFRSILVGGTNGKGSAASTLASILERRGERVGLFTSPHLSYVAERFRVNGEMLALETLEEALVKLRPEAARLEATFFEILTVLACQLFEGAGVRWAVMEVGLGGRYDATNALEPVLSILTGVSLDHTDILGDTVELIAEDKAQIFRAERPAFAGAVGAALGVIREEATRIGARLRVVGEVGSADIGVEVRSSDWRGLELRVRWPDERLEVRTPLLGRHQARNVALAVAAARELGVPDEAVRGGTKATRWPGRLEPLPYRGRTVLLDGAHNPEAARVLALALDDLGVRGFTLLFGAGEDKDVKGILSALEPQAERVFLTRSSLSPRATPPETLKALASRGAAVADPLRALEQAIEGTPEGGTVLAAGSLYLVGELRPYLLGEALERLERWQ